MKGWFLLSLEIDFCSTSSSSVTIIRNSKSTKSTPKLQIYPVVFVYRICPGGCDKVRYPQCLYGLLSTLRGESLTFLCQTVTPVMVKNLCQCFFISLNQSLMKDIGKWNHLVSCPGVYTLQLAGGIISITLALCLASGFSVK